MVDGCQVVLLAEGEEGDFETLGTEVGEEFVGSLAVATLGGAFGIEFVEVVRRAGEEQGGELGGVLNDEGAERGVGDFHLVRLLVYQ